MQKKFTFSVAGLIILILLIAGCSNVPAEDGLNSTNQQVKIVASFYPLYEIAKKVGGEYVTVKNLVPAGAEPHDYEPTPQDLMALNEAQLVIFNGAGIEPWTNNVLPGLMQKGISIINESESFRLIRGEYMNEEAEAEPDSQNEAAPLDPHIWLDPAQYANEAIVVAEKLAGIDPSHKDIFKQNAANFGKELADLDQLYKDGLKSCKFRSFITAHAAFGYLAKRYNLEMIPISGLSPDSEPSPKVLGDLANLIKSKGIKYVLTETLVSPKTAETLANEVGAKTLILNPLEGLSDQEIAQGKDYIAVMKDNLQTLRTALECG